MAGMVAHMRAVGWFGGPVVVDDGVVQDRHHGLVTAAWLEWWHLDIPVVET
jgi:hypothetical protein